jgi:hypothetical protein
VVPIAWGFPSLDPSRRAFLQYLNDWLYRRLSSQGHGSARARHAWLPLDTDRFVEDRWHRALRATGIRGRKFYATRHTFISVALDRGCKYPHSAEKPLQHLGVWRAA